MKADTRKHHHAVLNASQVSTLNLVSDFPVIAYMTCSPLINTP